MNDFTQKCINIKDNLHESIGLLKVSEISSIIKMADNGFNLKDIMLILGMIESIKTNIISLFPLASQLTILKDDKSKKELILTIEQFKYQIIDMVEDIFELTNDISKGKYFAKG